MGIPIIRNQYKINHDAFLTRTEESSYWAGLFAADGCVKMNKHKCIELISTDKELIDGFRAFLKADNPIYVKTDGKGYLNESTAYILNVKSPFIMDDMKLWSLEPRKSQKTKVPEWMSSNLDCLYQWLVGLTDGNGSIYLKKQGKYIYPTISIMGSMEVMNYLKLYIPIKSSLHSEKGLDNLFSARYSGKSAMALYQLIYKNRGLKRKWSKLKDFVNANY
jgi:LAGLIDADG DNA endonuclease family protein